VTVAFITGITGQDGSYLAELLLEKGYIVHGLMRPSSVFTTERIEPIFDHPLLHLHYGDMIDQARLTSLLYDIGPDEIYNLAAQSHVKVSFDVPAYTAHVDAIGVCNLLEAMRSTCASARFYQASTSEMFGNAPDPQNEETPFNPQSPYAAAKVYAHHMCTNYREAYGLHISCGILFNHESPRRGETFVTRKITKAFGRIKRGEQTTLALGNIHAIRDWGWAPDYVEAMWRMLQQRTPDDYVIATGETHTVEDFLTVAAAHAGLPLSWRNYVTRHPRYLRPTEVHALCGDATKAHRTFGWTRSVTFEELVRRMVEADL